MARKQTIFIPVNELGTVYDADLALRYGCTPSTVRAARNAAGIPPYRSTRPKADGPPLNRWRDSELLPLAYRPGMTRADLVRALEAIAVGAARPVPEGERRDPPAEWVVADGYVTLPGDSLSALAQSVRAKLGMPRAEWRARRRFQSLRTPGGAPKCAKCEQTIMLGPEVCEACAVPVPVEEIAP